MDTKGKGLLYEMKNGYPITMSEEEYKAKEKEIRSIASDLYVNMDVLDLVEKDYKLKLLVLSMASYFGFDRATGEGRPSHLPGRTEPHEILLHESRLDPLLPGIHLQRRPGHPLP